VRRPDLTRAALYAGGFLGPFGGGVVVVLVPELRDALHTTTAGAGATLTAYLVPFALLQLVSGTLGARWGISRTIRGGYVVYAVASIAVAAATSLAPFLALRAIQGAANAFLTPLLMSRLADATPEAGLGRAMGTYSSVQTSGVVLAPLVGGLAAAADYRLAFLIPAATAIALALAPQPADRGRDGGDPTLRAALTPRVRAICAVTFVTVMCTIGLSFVISLRLADEFRSGSVERGLVLAVFGVAGVLAGRAAGGLVDRFGPRPVALRGAVATAALVPLIGLSGSPWLLGAFWFLTGVATSLVFSALYVMTTSASLANRAGAFSMVGAARHTGTAVAPFAWLPVYHASTWLPFVAAGVLAAGSIVFVRRRAALT
jgi:MFS family permease